MGLDQDFRYRSMRHFPTSTTRSFMPDSASFGPRAREGIGHRQSRQHAIRDFLCREGPFFEIFIAQSLALASFRGGDLVLRRDLFPFTQWGRGAEKVALGIMYAKLLQTGKLRLTLNAFCNDHEIEIV